MRYDGLLTFGGGYSNHIAATAAAGSMFGIPTIGIIRGDELNASSNETLKKAAADGMKLEFVSRGIYAQRYERIYHEELRVKYGNILIVEEGGANHYGVVGASEIMTELPFEPTRVYVAAGTGTTAAGLLYSTENVQVHAIAALKGGEFLTEEIRGLLYYALLDESLVDEKLVRLELNTHHHFGGYGHHTPDLLSFMASWSERFDIPLDQVYTGKMIFAFQQDLLQGKLMPGSKIVLVHTGGIQGSLLKQGV